MSGQSNQRARLRALAVVLVVPLVMAGGLGLLFWTRSVRTLGRIPSPDAKWTATVRVVNWGGYSTHISIERSDSWFPSRQSKVFVADDGGGAVPLGQTGELAVGLRWEGSARVVISYPAKARIYRKELEVGPVGVAYNPQ